MERERGLRGYGKKNSLCKGPGVERSTVQKPRSPAAVGRGCLAEAGEATWRQVTSGEPGHRKGSRLCSKDRKVTRLSLYVGCYLGDI